MKMKNTANRDTAWYDARTACLAEFMTPERNEVLRRTVAMRTRYMTVMAENMYHGQNAAALIRHCEAFGIQEMHTVETLCRFDPNPDIARRHRPMGRRAAPSLYRRGARRTAPGRVPHRGDDTPPRGCDARDFRRHARAVRTGLRHRARRNIRRSHRRGGRIPAHPDVRMVESLNVRHRPQS